MTKQANTRQLCFVTCASSSSIILLIRAGVIFFFNNRPTEPSTGKGEKSDLPHRQEREAESPDLVTSHETPELRHDAEDDSGPAAAASQHDEPAWAAPGGTVRGEEKKSRSSRRPRGQATVTALPGQQQAEKNAGR